MNKIILTLTAVAMTACSYAQMDSAQNKMNPTQNNRNDDGMMKNRDLNNNQIQNEPKNAADMSHPDGVMMQDGKMIIIKDGRMVTLKNDMTLDNGMVVMSNGSYMKKGGTKMMFKEVEHMDMSGKMIPMNNSRNMNGMPDSTNNKNKFQK